MNLASYRQFNEGEWARLPALFSAPTLKWVDVEIDGSDYDRMPLLLDRKGRTVEAPTSWLTLIRINGAKQKTQSQYAYVLRKYWEFLGERDWRLPDDAILRSWRNSCLAEGVSGRRVNLCLDAIVAFLLWAQSECLIRNRIGATPPGGEPFPVRLIPRRRRRGTLVSHVRAEVLTTPRAPVPSATEMELMYARITGSNEAISERNCLIADLAVECGLRRGEILALNVSAVPTFERIKKLERDAEPCRLRVTGKGGKVRDVAILPELARRLRDHVDGNRRTILGSSTVDKGALFLSSKNGQRINENWVSKIFSRAFSGAEARKLTLHRLRARFASLIVLMLVRREARARGLVNIREEFILKAAAEYLGQSDTSSLPRYVDLHIQTLQAQADVKCLTQDGVGVDFAVLEPVSLENQRLSKRAGRNH